MKLNIIIVLYQLKPIDSIAIQSILNLFPKFDEKFDQYMLTVYDNGPTNQSADLIDLENVNYIHDERNLGLSTAYNYAYHYSVDHKFDWLLLFDHDTELSETYIDEFLNASKNFSENVVAMVPQVISNDVIVSPVATNTMYPLNESRPAEGLHNDPITAINSGSFLRISFLNDIKGFTDEFPLDYLDHWLFHKIYEKKKAVMVAHSKLQHELSILNFEQININRYRSILDSESSFYKNYKPNLLKPYKKHLLIQGLKQSIVIKNKKIFMYTLKKYFTL
ncbi:glycosyltransferase [Carnobacterium divergens]|uniref:Glycosyltransferase n=1 Tax=Carnobacterium divergens TaxID=2748 RepID=A0AAW8R9G2_CARDV|nr:glycosyltransferase [Carnobacterium divergens]MDT1957616.1 glycosyltransferase [Carnobacterium divergens]MDT1974310.1 glycosyltransferase [Carnobacterium divergens]MDT2011814.1 glycosyltransferase [Carnobacterium divergens]